MINRIIGLFDSFSRIGNPFLQFVHRLRNLSFKLHEEYLKRFKSKEQIAIRGNGLSIYNPREQIVEIENKNW